MADDDKTRFHFNFGGIKLELAGDRKFVERMYQQVMRDVQTSRNRATQKGRLGAPQKKEGSEKKPSVWVHRCGDMMRKIYMASENDVEKSALGKVIDVTVLENLYLNRDVFPDFFPDMEGGYTLWAEFTTVGRQKLSEATGPKRKVLRGQESKS